MKSVKLLSLAALGFVLTAASAEACPRDGSAVAAINQSFMGNNLVDLDRTLGLQGPNCARKMVYNVTVDLRDLNDGPGRQGRGELLYRPLNQNYRGNNTLALRQILGMGPELRGRRIEHVVLRASTAAGQGTATLTVNGLPVGPSQTVGRISREYRFDLPRRADEIGPEVQQLQIELRARLSRSELSIKVERPENTG